MNSPAPNGFSDDPFLSDIEAVAAAAPVSPAATGTSDGVVAGFSPKMWVVLLGSVIILYLLFAPDRQNSPEMHNR